MSEWTPNPRPADDTSVVQEHRNWFQLQIVLLICRFTPTCPEVIRILSVGMDKPLPLPTRIKLRIHYLMCSFCARYAKQLNYMSSAVWPTKQTNKTKRTAVAMIRDANGPRLRTKTAIATCASHTQLFRGLM